jgi:dephospho-CoA kinase
MLVIGLTGGIGTGKSEVSRILGDLGATVINADQVGHEAYTPHSQIWREVVAAFGEGILQPSGEIDRKRLGAIVFSEPDARARLNSIMHPRMAEMISQQIGELREQGVELVVLEAALMVEAGWNSLVDEVWVTDAPEEHVLERLRQRNSLSEEEIRSRISSQLPFEERARHARAVVHNSGSLAELRDKVESLWSRVRGKVS